MPAQRFVSAGLIHPTYRPPLQFRAALERRRKRQLVSRFEASANYQPVGDPRQSQGKFSNNSPNQFVVDWPSMSAS